MNLETEGLQRVCFSGGAASMRQGTRNEDSPDGGPLIVGQLPSILQPGDGGGEGGVVFHLTLKHHRSAPLDHFVLRLLQDSCRF